MSDKSFSNQPPKCKVYDSELFTRHYHTEHRCANTTSNARENEEVKTSETCGVNNYADCFPRVYFLVWRSRDGVCLRVGAGAGSGLVALGYSCPPANQPSACECVCVSVLCDSIIMRLAAGYHRPITDVYRLFGRGNLSMSRLRDTHTYTRRVHTVWPLTRQMDGCWNETLLESKTLLKFWQDGQCVCVCVNCCQFKLHCNSNTHSQKVKGQLLYVPCDIKVRKIMCQSALSVCSSQKHANTKTNVKFTFKRKLFTL